MEVWFAKYPAGLIDLFRLTGVQTGEMQWFIAIFLFVYAYTDRLKFVRSPWSGCTSELIPQLSVWIIC